LSQKLVFVVDDEPSVANTLTAILKRGGYSVRSFTEPLQALEALADPPPDLLMTDVVMPELNGVQLADKVLQKCPACKVLLISGNATYLQEYYLSKRFHLLEKPAPIAEIMSAVQTLIGSAS
jgi:DNA-binding NtrC family response regulator